MSGPTRDAAVTIGVVLTFAILVTVHAAILFGLGRRRRLGEVLAALVVPPLAPYWAFLRGMRARGVAWIASAALYAVALALAVFPR
jgi:hypothetical protein